MCKTENIHLMSELFNRSDRVRRVAIHSCLLNLRLFTIVGLAILLCSSPLVQSQILRESNYGKKDEYFSPGIKIGYTFGPNGGMTYGIEISYTKLYDEASAEGFVFDLDYTPTLKTWKAHGGYEIGTAFGLCAGPTLIFSPEKTEIAASLIPYIGGGLYFYYHFLIRFTSDPNIHEIGGYAKVPLQTVGGKFY